MTALVRLMVLTILDPNGARCRQRGSIQLRLLFCFRFCLFSFSLGNFLLRLINGPVVLVKRAAATSLLSRWFSGRAFPAKGTFQQQCQLVEIVVHELK